MWSNLIWRCLLYAWDGYMMFSLCFHFLFGVAFCVLFLWIAHHPAEPSQQSINMETKVDLEQHHNAAFVTCFRRSELNRFASVTYLDHAGMALYAEGLVKSCYDLFQRSIFLNNEHISASNALLQSSIIDQCRDSVLNFLKASRKMYYVVFTSGATDSCRLLSSFLNWHRVGVFAYMDENHSSILGIRQSALEANVKVGVFGLENLEDLYSSDFLQSCLIDGPGNIDENKEKILALPCESNFSGIRPSLDIVKTLQSEQGGQWKVILDAARSASVTCLDLEKYPVDFVILSFYKIFGFPTGLGALVVKNSALPLILPTRATSKITVTSLSSQLRSNFFSPATDTDYRPLRYRRYQPRVGQNERIPICSTNSHETLSKGMRGDKSPSTELTTTTLCQTSDEDARNERTSFKTSPFSVTSDDTPFLENLSLGRPLCLPTGSCSSYSVPDVSVSDLQYFDESRYSPAVLRPQRHYFGGRSVLSVSSTSDFVELCPGIQALEAGSPNIQAIACLKKCFEFYFEGEPYRMNICNINRYLEQLTKYAVHKLLQLRHVTSKKRLNVLFGMLDEPLTIDIPAVYIYGLHSNWGISNCHHNSMLLDSEGKEYLHPWVIPNRTDDTLSSRVIGSQGPIISMIIVNQKGKVINPKKIVRAAAKAGIVISGGSHNNIGACQRMFSLSGDDVLRNYSCGHTVGEDADSISGRPTGCIRVSFGLSTSIEDVDRFVAFIESTFVRAPSVLRVTSSLPVSKTQGAPKSVGLVARLFGDSSKAYEGTPVSDLTAYITSPDASPLPLPPVSARLTGITQQITSNIYWVLSVSHFGLSFFRRRMVDESFLSSLSFTSIDEITTPINEVKKAPKKSWRLNIFSNIKSDSELKLVNENDSLKLTLNKNDPIKSCLLKKNE
eukprot:GHVL01044836.1.p1 GENE.GHVL01044836.1~~GHVL01044836.1.p1  ORF type:complete len:899 (+),score=95.91 GHVL01044836.1:93-2789(+)